jgi:hypothetical protein
MRSIGPILLVACMACGALRAQEPAADAPGAGTMAFRLEMRNGSGDYPMVVLWIEDADRQFVQTLRWFSKDRKYYKDLTTWTLRSSKAKEGRAELDAVTSATIKWKATGEFSIPLRTSKYDLTKGGYRIRIESRRDKGGHYRTFRIPIKAGFAGGVFEDKGYVKKVTIKIEGKQL